MSTPPAVVGQRQPNSPQPNSPQPNSPQLSSLQPWRTSRRRGWRLFAMATAITIAWGLLWGLFVHVRMDAYVGGVIPFGQSWTDKHGTTFTVLKTEHKQVLPRGPYSDALKAPQGATFLLVKMRVQNWHEGSGCSFVLVGGKRELWRSNNSNLPRLEDKNAYQTCPVDMPSNVDYWLSFLLPTDRIATAVGITHYYMALRHEPALALPSP